MELEAELQTSRRDGESGFDRIWVSDLSRAGETAEIIAARLKLEISVDLRLRELDVGDWSGRARSEILERDAERLIAFEEGDPEIQAGGGESRVALRLRAQAFVADRAADSAGGRLIVVTHLGVIRALVPGADPTNAERIEVIAEEVISEEVVRRAEEL